MYGKVKTIYDTGQQIYNTYRQALPIAEGAMNVAADVGRSAPLFAALVGL